MNSIIDYLKDSVEKYPDKIAIADKDHEYTFKQLQQTSMELAAVPALMNYKKDGVGVFISRNADILTLFLGAVFSGHYYIPLDPDLPEAKLNLIIENSDISLILGSPENAGLLKSINRCVDFITINDIVHDVTNDNSSNLNPESPLFMVYTSGSTGIPKGVLKSHKSIMSFIEAYVERFDFSSNDVIGNQTPFFFDASAKDIYLMLKIGATLEILPTEYFTMPVQLIKYMNEKKVTFISWVPSALSIIVQLNTFAAILPQTLKKVFFIGEVMPMKHLNKWREALPDLQYVNLYGSTEVAGASCCYEVTGTFANDSNLPMGKPLSNCQAYVLSDNVIINEPGKIGELYIVSDALAIEYYGDQLKTENNFIYKDFGDGKLKRAYKTGDLVQYNENGDLVFASRSDFQIKHMGHRIELGEIETVAGALNDIQRCCCLYNHEKSRIVLFCQLIPESTLSDKDIKAMLSTKLSSYMVPNRVKILDEMPFNANNKIDRVKLKELL